MTVRCLVGLLLFHKANHRFLERKAVIMTLASIDLAGDFTERVRVNQRKLRSELKSHYDFIVCGSGSSGSVVAVSVAGNPNVNVHLFERGGVHRSQNRRDVRPRTGS